MAGSRYRMAQPTPRMAAVFARSSRHAATEPHASSHAVPREVAARESLAPASEVAEVVLVQHHAVDLEAEERRFSSAHTGMPARPFAAPSRRPLAFLT